MYKSDDDDGGDDDRNDDNISGLIDPKPEDDESDSEDEGVPDDMEDAIQKAHKHVRAAKVQRQEARKRMQEARDDLDAGKPVCKRRIVKIMDYSQNLYLPNFGAEQPGETYFYSPLNVYQFGIVDCSEKEDKLHAYVYREFEGKKGGNNVVSCLLENFKEWGFFANVQEGEITINADNCTGQNKNKTVIWFCNWLVETGIFPKVTLLFLVRGHTKNACDWLFNLLKGGYHKRLWPQHRFSSLSL